MMLEGVQYWEIRESKNLQNLCGLGCRAWDCMGEE